MTTLRMIVCGLALLAVSREAGAAAVVVSEDVSVYDQAQGSTNHNNNFYRGGLFSGVDGLAGSDNPARFYLKFNLPAFVPGTSVSSAILRGYYNDDWNSADDRTHHFYMAANDTWSQSTITWNNQPGSTGGALGLFDAAATTPQSWQSWDISAVTDQEYRGDGVLSLMFRADDESLVFSNNNWEYFARQGYNRDLAFRIDLVTQESVIPEPSALLVWLGLGALGVTAAWWRRRKAA